MTADIRTAAQRERQPNKSRKHQKKALGNRGLRRSTSRETGASSEEYWAPIPGYEDSYEASSQGRIRSIDRVVGEGRYQSNRVGRVLSLNPDRGGYMRVLLWRDNTKKGMAAHRLVALAFLGDQSETKVVCHRNGDQSDNRIENLYWGSMSENIHDAVRHGTHGMSRKTHCLRGHEFTGENTYFTPGTESPRHCRACRKNRSLEREARKAALMQKLAEGESVNERIGA